MKIILTAVVIGLGLPACASRRKGFSEVSDVDSPVCLLHAGVPTKKLEYLAMTESFGKQRMSQWNWAASSQMVLNYHHVEITQEQLVKHVFGRLHDGQISISQIRDVLNGMKASANGKPVRVTASVSELNFEAIETEMRSQRPMIVSLSDPLPATGSHARVLSGISYRVDSRTGRSIPYLVTMRNPMPNEPGKELMGWEEFTNRFVGQLQVKVEPF